MTDVKELTAEELLEHLIAQKQFTWQSPLLGEIRGRLKRLEKCEAALRLHLEHFGDPLKRAALEGK